MADLTTRKKSPRFLGDLLSELAVTRIPEPPDGWDAHDLRVAEAREREAVVERRVERRLRAQALHEDANFPKRAIEHVLDPELRRTRAIEFVDDFLAGDRSTLFLVGGTGTGQTTAATLFALDHGGASPGFVRASELESRGRYDRDLRDWMRARSSLVVDDLGVEVNDGKGNFRSLLDETIDMFHSDGKRIVVTGNIGEGDVLTRYGERIVSRLYESGVWSDCGEGDLRKQLPGEGAS